MDQTVSILATAKTKPPVILSPVAVSAYLAGMGSNVNWHVHKDSMDLTVETNVIV